MNAISYAKDITAEDLEEKLALSRLHMFFYTTGSDCRVASIQFQLSIS